MARSLEEHIEDNIYSVRNNFRIILYYNGTTNKYINVLMISISSKHLMMGRIMSKTFSAHTAPLLCSISSCVITATASANI